MKIELSKKNIETVQMSIEFMLERRNEDLEYYSPKEQDFLNMKQDIKDLQSLWNDLETEIKKGLLK
tara:strand:- start:280 stop:477 length:198 start_codon:yes stop_codon:yes gene_type:complete